MRSYFLSVYLCQIFLFSNKWSRQCGVDKHFASSSSGFESLSGHKSSWFRWLSSEIPIVPMAQWFGQHCPEAVGTGSNPASTYIFQSLLIRRKIVIPPPPPTPPLPENFRYQSFSGTQTGSPTNFFRHSETKKFNGKSSYPPLLFCMKYKNQWWKFHLWQLDSKN